MKRSAFYLDVHKLTDGELSDLIHELNDELENRSNKIARDDSKGWLKRQCDSAQLLVRSYSTTHQRNLKNSLL